MLTDWIGYPCFYIDVLTETRNVELFLKKISDWIQLFLDVFWLDTIIVRCLLPGYNCCYMFSDWIPLFSDVFWLDKTIIVCMLTDWIPLFLDVLTKTRNVQLFLNFSDWIQLFLDVFWLNTLVSRCLLPGYNCCHMFSDCIPLFQNIFCLDTTNFVGFLTGIKYHYTCLL